jgi:crotonobetainyl-CoA:carnitine CoA-transferase CaiB-like acyl-CoA transferase
MNWRKGSQEEYDRLLTELDMLNVLEDPRFGRGGREAIGQGRHARAVKPIWEEAFRKKPVEELAAIFDRANIEVVQYSNFSALAAHPQMRFLDLFQPLQHQVAGTITTILPPWTFARTPERPLRMPPPALGQHTAEVWAEAQAPAG